MNDQLTRPGDEAQATRSVTPRRPLLMIGSVLWGLCLLALVFLFYQRQQAKSLANRDTTIGSQSGAADDSDKNNGLSQTQIKLIPTKDGGFEAKQVPVGQDDNPWDPNGIEDFSFIDTEGQTVTKKDLLGKPFAISFIFTLCRGPCPRVTLKMRELQDYLKDYDFRLVSLTVDPDRDTMEILKLYGISQGADFSRWKFLTGKQSDIYGFIHRSFQMPVEPDSRGLPGFEIIHSTNIMLVNAEGRVVGKFDAQKDEPMSRLRNEMKRLCKLAASTQPTEPAGEVK